MVNRCYAPPDPAADLSDRLIMDYVESGSRVLDLGCGDGRLLGRIRDELGCSVQGLELDHRRVVETISKGLPVIKADLDHGLAGIADASFDVAILSQTLQQVRQPRELLVQMLRVAGRAVVLVPNFAHWWVRLQILFSGRAPVTQSLPYDWYNTPNIHFLSITDFRDLVDQLRLRIEAEVPIIHGHAVPNAWGANFRADSALFVLSKRALRHNGATDAASAD
jgi:methionine biosynthesis protein MetW